MFDLCMLNCPFMCSILRVVIGPSNEMLWYSIYFFKTGAHNVLATVIKGLQEPVMHIFNDIVMKNRDVLLQQWGGGGPVQYINLLKWYGSHHHKEDLNSKVQRRFSHRKGPSGEQIGELRQKSDLSVLCRNWYYTQQSVYQWQIASSFKRHFTVKWQMILWGIKRHSNANSLMQRKQPELSQHMSLFPHQEGNISSLPFPFYELWCLPLVEMGKWCEVKSPVLCYNCFYCCFSNLMPSKLLFYVRIFQFFIRRHITNI